MNESDKLKKLAEKAGCCSSENVPDHIRKAAKEHGVDIANDAECVAAKFRLCPKTEWFPKVLWPADVEAGVCSICKAEVGWTPGVAGPTVLICIDCALIESDEETITE